MKLHVANIRGRTPVISNVNRIVTSHAITPIHSINVAFNSLNW